MMLNPSVLKRAQEEIDAVFGHDNHSIPGFVNMDDLPYCFALTKEVFRYVLIAFFEVYHYLPHSEAGDHQFRLDSPTVLTKRTFIRDTRLKPTRWSYRISGPCAMTKNTISVLLNSIQTGSFIKGR